MAREADLNRYEINKIPVNGPGIDTIGQPGILKVVFAGQHEGFEEGSQFIWDFGDPYADLSQPNVHRTTVPVDYSNPDHQIGRFVFTFSYIRGQMVAFNEVASVELQQSPLWWSQPQRNVLQFKEDYIPADGTMVHFDYYVDNKNFLIVDNPEELVIHTYTFVGKYVARLMGKLPNGVQVEASKAVTVGVVTTV